MLVQHGEAPRKRSRDHHSSDTQLLQCLTSIARLADDLAFSVLVKAHGARGACRGTGFSNLSSQTLRPVIVNSDV